VTSPAEVLAPGASIVVPLTGLRELSIACPVTQLVEELEAIRECLEDVVRA
jgi:hypothetical protein